MVGFEVIVNGEQRFVGEYVTAITLVSDLIARRQVDRVSMHIGTDGPGEREVHHLGADLRVGDEITIRLVEEEQIYEADDPAPGGCSFCGSGIDSVRSLVSGKRAAICDSCLVVLSDVVMAGAPLPIGASIRETPGDEPCGFCHKAPPEVPALLVRNASAICPECLRSCVDLRGEREV